MTTLREIRERLKAVDDELAAICQEIAAVRGQLAGPVAPLSPPLPPPERKTLKEVIRQEPQRMSRTNHVPAVEEDDGLL